MARINAQKRGYLGRIKLERLIELVTLDIGMSKVQAWWLAALSTGDLMTRSGQFRAVLAWGKWPVEAWFWSFCAVLVKRR